MAMLKKHLHQAVIYLSCHSSLLLTLLLYCYTVNNNKNIIVTQYSRSHYGSGMAINSVLPFHHKYALI